MNKTALIITIFFASLLLKLDLQAQALEAYLSKPEPSYSWKKVDEKKIPGGKVYVLNLTSQTWRDIVWSHQIGIVVPDKILNKNYCFLRISGTKDVLKDIAEVKEIALNSGTAGAILSAVPNQPLFGGLTEDRLLAYTLRSYVDSGDDSWPILFPMVKSATKAMDGISEFGKKIGLSLNSYVVSGASKRGWTSYLVAGTDRRVKGLAPLVFDMLNMKAQTELAAKTYGAQSEKIKNYTELGLVERIDEPRTAQLRKWIDPYEYKEKLTMPKLILLGTNDPYWVVDSQKHYFGDLPGEKLIYQSPNGTHHIGDNPTVKASLHEWYRLIVNSEKLPEMKWEITKNKVLKVSSNMKIASAAVWRADSPIRDFRSAVWDKSTMKLENLSAEIQLTAPKSGFTAWMAEIIFDINGSLIKLSTIAFVSDTLD